MKKLVIYQGDNYHYCIECNHVIVFGEMIAYDKSKLEYICQKCILGETRTMPNIKITAEVDGKIVPLRTISTESFEAIKVLEKPKEIPVARIGNHKNNLSDKRLFLRIGPQLRNTIVAQRDIKMVAIGLKRGHVNMTWPDINGNLEELYENVHSL